MSGSISGGSKLEAYLRNLAKKTDKSATLRVGFLEGATYPDGTSVPMVAAIQEFGAPSKGIPPRPYFRRMIAEKQDTWGPAIADLLKANDYDAEKTLNMAGAGIKGQLQQSIRDLTSPPLSPKTVKRKGFDKPLVDTGHMLNSVDYDVKTGA
jgi:hypothetical protein